MQYQFSYSKEINTQQQTKRLFIQASTQNINDFVESFPSLYEFCIQSENGQFMVYRTHDEIINFTRKLDRLQKPQQLHFPKKIAFEDMKNNALLNKISQLKNTYQLDWFIKFFDLESPIKGKKISANLKKQSGGRYSQYKCCLNWKSCKAFVLNDGVVTYNQSKNKIQQFLHFGKDFSWQSPSNIENLKIQIHSYHRKLNLQAKTAKQYFIFVYCLQKYLKKYQGEQKVYRFNSFAPVRENNEVQFFVDGAEYFQALAYGIEKAQQQVFICGWWISPQFWLVRPCTGTNLDYRLDKLLARKAKSGVKIHIVVYFQSSFLSNDSAYTIQALQSLDMNIRVLRHPQIVLPTYWSHHEKLIVIDQQIAFMGGLDICYGRYDNQLHLINSTSAQLYPGIEYNNCRIADFIQVRDYRKENVPRHLPRLPWHDVTLMVKGKSVKDLSRHFIQYWNYASYQTHYADRYVLLSNNSQFRQKKKTGIFGSIVNDIKQKFSKLEIQFQGGGANKTKRKMIEQQEAKHAKMVQEVNQTKHPSAPKRMFSLQGVIERITPNKFQKTAINHSPKEQSDKLSIYEKKQSPTTEQVFYTIEEKNQPIYLDQILFIGKNIKKEEDEEAERELQQKQNKRIQQTQKQAESRIRQVAKIEQQIQQRQHIQQGVQDDYIQQKSKHIQPSQRTSLQNIIRGRGSFFNKIMGHIKRPQTFDEKKFEENLKKQIPGNAIFVCQALRSASQWSIGCRNSNSQKSIYDAYLSLIGRAQKFIYIENQFFISATHENGVVKNKVMQALADRIIRAIQQKKQFKVIIIMPLIPGFAGQLDDPEASLPRVIMNWQYKTICRGKQSLIGRLKQHTADPFQYIQILGLRTHGIINEQPVTQIIYLHSKLMIVDDRYLICGSANINDRSMEGNRDSQLCLLVQAAPHKQIPIRGSFYKVVEKIHMLRVRLWEEHFGIVQFKLRDPTCPKLWAQIKQITKNNTEIYRNIFGCYPDSQIKNLDQIKKFKKTSANRKQYDQQTLKIQGHAVQFPLEFLQKQKLTSYHPNAIST